MTTDNNTKRNLAIRISDETDLSPMQVLDVMQKLFDHMTEGLAAGERYEFRNFGVFETAMRKSRVGRNPRQPVNTVVIPERRVVKFKPGKNLRGFSVPPKVTVP
ncbi:MAG: HU family DNA-binding protein [bacterium]